MLVEQPASNQLALHLAKLLTYLPSLGSVRLPHRSQPLQILPALPDCPGIPCPFPREYGRHWPRSSRDLPLREPANSRFFDRYMERGEQLMTAMFPDCVRISSLYQTIPRNNVGKSGVSNLIPHSIRDLNLLIEDQHSASCKQYSCQKSFFADIAILLAGILKAVFRQDGACLIVRTDLRRMRVSGLRARASMLSGRGSQASQKAGSRSICQWRQPCLSSGLNARSLLRRI